MNHRRSRAGELSPPLHQDQSTNGTLFPITPNCGSTRPAEVAACVDRGGIEHLMNRLTTDDINSILVRRPAGAPEALVVGGTRRSSAPASQTSAGMTCGTSGPAGTCRTVRPSCASRARRLGDFRNGAPVCALLGRAPGAVCGSTVCATAGDGACGGTNLSQASNLRCQAKLSH